MSTLGEFKDYDEALARLAEAQRYKLRVNEKKGWLGDVPPSRLLNLLKKEIAELEDAFQRGSQIEIILEAADIANFALGFVISAIQSLNTGVKRADSNTNLPDGTAGHDVGPKVGDHAPEPGPGSGGTFVLRDPIRR